ncbi:MAG TPA: cytosolic protein [Candidatus Eisenbacteria bacterium]|uniref:Cytosolic protein n=1 Tax=Eiseniibacteriota bacterium TaxID=2212470 RepID=A0A7V2F466_UNCEI|nr:cytosolic protein [Candidatus Eisenbacteria bacterium]
MDCGNLKKNMDRCNCSYPGCPRKGNCCECLHYHLAMDELPACCFPDDVERTFDRSFRRFIETRG